jgi:hypothetical protein
MSKLDKWSELQWRLSTSDGEVVFLIEDGDLELHTKFCHFSNVEGQLAII